jgi:hypothetical protein
VPQQVDRVRREGDRRLRHADRQALRDRASGALGYGEHIIRDGHEVEGGGEVWDHTSNPPLLPALRQHLIDLTWLTQRRHDDVVEGEVRVQGETAAHSRVVAADDAHETLREQLSRAKLWREGSWETDR